eukprot:12399849-Karenia_brevis.AAC.1
MSNFNIQLQFIITLPIRSWLRLSSPENNLTDLVGTPESVQRGTPRAMMMVMMTMTMIILMMVAMMIMMMMMVM